MSLFLYIIVKSMQACLVTICCSLGFTSAFTSSSFANLIPPRWFFKYGKGTNRLRRGLENLEYYQTFPIWTFETDRDLPKILLANNKPFEYSLHFPHPRQFCFFFFCQKWMAAGTKKSNCWRTGTSNIIRAIQSLWR